ncbi:MAG TPA: hypothetical protein VJZ27_00060 [Aggregatilineales bacterium]|nr:hypothetical protein [Aggregatilineales bacterium]
MYSFLKRFTMLPVCILMMLAGFNTGLYAQDSPADMPLLLTVSVDPQTGNASLQWINLADKMQHPITSFNAVSYCLPQVFGDGTKLLYEPYSPGQSPLTFEINMNSGSITPLDASGQLALRCPVINPDEESIAWLHQSENSDQLFVTNMDLSNPVNLAEHGSIENAIWSPDGTILIYTGVDEDPTFRPLYANADAKYNFWQRDSGLVVDYTWVPDGNLLLLLYYTQDNAILGGLSRDCVLSVQTCAPMPLALFGLNSGLRFANAFSPDGVQVVVIEEAYNDAGELITDLFSINTRTGKMMRLTDSPSLVEVNAVWTGDTIYFVGGEYDPMGMSFTESAVYRIPAQGGTAEIAFAAEGYFPIQILWYSE